MCNVMSLSSSFLRNAIVGCFLMVSAPGVLLAQTGYVTNGVEYAIAGALPGDQYYPQLGIGPLGGFLVWEDNVCDADGRGIAAVGLDSNLQKVQAPFRVNATRAKDQERPRVALLKNGGAAFVWQGGRFGLQHIYGRFLSPSNMWAGTDVAVSTSTNASQRHPVVAALGNGNAVVIWSSFNQRSLASYHDIYGQILSPMGQKIGAEFPVNQFYSFNQRNPAVAALPGGGFVVTWVSEQQNRAIGLTNAVLTSAAGQPSVDIYAQAYDGNGIKSGYEFLVNTGSRICNNPAIAAAADGTFVICWAEKDLQVRSNSWDVYTRAFAANRSGGPVQRVNTYQFGDQFVPQVSAVGTNYLVVWTSLRQDGSWEGVFGRYLSGDATPDGGEFLVNTTVLGRQIEPAVASDGAGRFAVTWTSYTEGTRAFDVFAQQYSGPSYEPIALTTNYAGPVLADSVNGVPFGGAPVLAGELPKLEFPGAQPAGGSVAANAFMLARGYYYGLFYAANGVTTGSSGYLTALTTERQTYSGKLWLGSAGYALAGKFDSAGHATATVNRRGQAPLIIDLQLDLTGGDQIHGSINGGSWIAELRADRLTFSKAHPAPFAGYYTLVIPPASEAQNPSGYGYGAVQVDGLGKVVWSATLADGSKVSQQTAISKEGIWPLYAAPYAGRGLTLGWVQLNTNDLNGQFVWVKPGGLPGKVYPSGFTNQVQVTLSPFGTDRVQQSAHWSSRKESASWCSAGAVSRCRSRILFGWTLGTAW